MKPVETRINDTTTHLLYPEGSFEATFGTIFGEAFDLLVERQNKYGPANIRDQGLYGVYQRIARDKLSRIAMSLNGRIENGVVVLDDIPDFADESFEDSCMDVANYALIMVALKRGLWGHPLTKDM